MRAIIALILVGLGLCPYTASAQGGCTAADALAAFQEAAIPIGDVMVYDEETDVNHLLGRVGGYVEKVSWHDTRLLRQLDTSFSVDDGGSIERYPTLASRDQRAAYLGSFDGTLLRDGYRHLAGGLILRLGSRLTPSQADGYRLVLVETCASVGG